jgi:hypothetical protein
MASTTGDSDVTPTTQAPAPRTRRRAVIAAILSLVVFIVSVGVLYVQWWRSDNPNSLIIVQGNAALDEVAVTVTRLSDPTWEAMRRQVKDGDDHSLRFHVPQGRYHVTIAGPGLKALKVDDFEVTPDEPRQLDLTPYAVGK